MNIPNKLSILRIILIPFIVAFFLIQTIPCGKLIAVLLFIIASITDFVDGYVARKYNMVTDTGKFLDPIADKMLVMAGVLIIFQNPFIPSYLLIISAIIIFARDYVVNSLRQVGVAKGCVIAASMSGKIKAFALDVAVVLIMFYDAMCQTGWFSSNLLNAIWWLSVIALIFSIIMVIYSTVDYFILNKSVLKNQQSDDNSSKKG